jgi:hypothetical protein
MGQAQDPSSFPIALGMPTYRDEPKGYFPMKRQDSDSSATTTTFRPLPMPVETAFLGAAPDMDRRLCLLAGEPVFLMPAPNVTVAPSVPLREMNKMVAAAMPRVWALLLHKVEGEVMTSVPIRAPWPQNEDLRLTVPNDLVMAQLKLKADGIKDELEGKSLNCDG